MQKPPSETSLPYLKGDRKRKKTDVTSVHLAKRLTRKKKTIKTKVQKTANET